MNDTPSMASENRRAVWLLGAAVSLIIGVFLLRKVSEYDIWFHMTMGKEILRTGSLPWVDRFSQLNMGRPYHDSQWLFQVVAAFGYGLMGFWWLQALQVVLWGGTFFQVYRACRVWSTSVGSWLLVLAVALASEERFSIRPELVTVLMVSLYYRRLQQGKYRSWRDIALLAILQIVWTNCHGVFVIGPVLAACYLAEALVRWRIDRDFTDARRLGLLMAALSVGCILTPFGLDGLKFAWLLMVEVSPAAPAVFKTVYDLEPVFGEASRSTVAFWVFLPLLIGTVISIIAALPWNSRLGRFSIARTLIVLSMLVVALTGIRNMPLFAVVAAPLMAENLSHVSQARRRQSLLAVSALLVVSMLVWTPRYAFQSLVDWVPYRFGLGLSGDYVPLQLPRFLDSIGFAGPVLNSQSLGGFYEYHGYPRRIPFFDGRFEAYDPALLDAAYEAMFGAKENPDRWQQFVRRYGFRGLLLENGPDESSGLLALLAASPDWRLVYLDYAASFWLRTDQPNLPPAVSAAQISELAERASSYANIENMFLFLDGIGFSPELRLRLMERGVRHRANQFTLINLGKLQLQSGQVDQAERNFRQALEQSPDSRTTLITLAQIAMIRGDRLSAERYLLKGLEYYPGDAILLENLTVVRGMALKP
uniref:TPR domain protein n=1 Tax=Geobacter metallireducens TaxID=28232 RepID=A0A831U345_GEOME